MTNCSDALDCSFNGVARLCSQTNTCACNPWYGWRGDQCDETSFQLNYQRVMLFITLLAEFIVLGLALHLLRSLLLKGKREIQGRNMILTMLILVLLGVLLLILSTTIQLPAFFDSTLFEVREYFIGFGDTIDVLYKHDVLSHALLIACVAPNMVFNVLVIHSWYKVVRSLGVFFPQIVQKMEEQQLKFLIVLVPLIIIGSIVALALQQLHVIILVGTVFVVLGTLGSYPMLYKYVLKPMSPEFVGSDKNLYKKAYDFMLFCQKVHLLLTFLVYAFGLIAFLLFSHKDKLLAPNAFNYISIFRDLFLFTMLTYFFFDLWYLKRILHNLTARPDSSQLVTEGV